MHGFLSPHFVNGQAKLTTSLEIASLHRYALIIDHAIRHIAALAQLVEHVIRNDGVSSSSLLSGTIFLSLSFKWRMAMPNQLRAILDLPKMCCTWKSAYIQKNRYVLRVAMDVLL